VPSEVDFLEFHDSNNRDKNEQATKPVQQIVATKLFHNFLLTLNIKVVTLRFKTESK